MQMSKVSLMFFALVFVFLLPFGIGLSGGEIFIYLSDGGTGYTLNLPHKDVSVSGFDSSEYQEEMVWLNYKGHQAGFKVRIVEDSTSIDDYSQDTTQTDNSRLMLICFFYLSCRMYNSHNSSPKT